VLVRDTFYNVRLGRPGGEKVFVCVGCRHKTGCIATVVRLSWEHNQLLDPNLFYAIFDVFKTYFTQVKKN
jgi:hypothetical protein